MSQYLTREAIRLLADWALENVDIVLDDGPAGAVGRLAVERVLRALLGQAHRAGEVLFVHRPVNQLVVIF